MTSKTSKLVTCDQRCEHRASAASETSKLVTCFHSSAGPVGARVALVGEGERPAAPECCVTVALETAYGLDVPEACPACATPPDDDRPGITSPEAAAAVLVPRLSGRDREACLALLLDTRHRLVTVETVSIGSIDHTFMSPREVFRDALLANAAALVLGHNHPSGDAEPSRDDERVTRRLAEAARLIGIELLDHLVVGDGRWTSLARRGCLG